MSNTVDRKSLRQDVVSRVGYRPRDRRDRPCGDPARRLPRPLSRARRRRERPNACLGGKAVHPGRNAGDARRERPHVCADDASAQGGRGRSYLRSAVPERARRVCGDLPGPAVHGDRLRRSADTASVDSQITGVQRAISVSIDNVHGSLSQLQAGDSIDLYVALGGGGPGGQALVKLFKPNVKVLMVPAVPGPSGGSNLILRIETGEAADFAYMADNTQMYFVIRPVVGAKPTKRDHCDGSIGVEVERNN